MAEHIAKISRSSNTPGKLLLHMGETSTWLDDREFKRTNSLTHNPKPNSNNEATLQKKREESGIWSNSHSSFSSFDISRHHTSPHDDEITVNMKREVTLQVEQRRSITASSSSSLKEQKISVESFEDDGKLWSERERVNRGSEVMTGVEKGMGVHTKVWGP